MVKQPALLYYDPHCRLCVAVSRLVRSLDFLERLEFRTGLDDAAAAARLQADDLHRAAYLITPDGAAYEGFFAFRQLTLRLPALWLLVPLAWLPGAALAGVAAYRWISDHRTRMFGCQVEE